METGHDHSYLLAAEGIRSRAARALCTCALALMAAVVFAGCGGADTSAASAKPAGPPQHGGQAVMGMDQEPPVLNTKLVAGSMLAAQTISDPMMDRWIESTPENVYRPVLLVAVPTAENGLVKVVGGKMTVTFDIQPAASWSDGKPITCDDMVFTWKTAMDDRWLIGTRVGYELIEKIDCPTPKRVVIHFREPYAPYLDNILDTWPLPAHELEGKDFNTYWNSGFTVTSGAFRFKHWKRNVEVVLERNPEYWNKGKENLPYLDSLKFRFLKDGNTLKIQLRTGEVDYINPPPDTNLREELKSFPRSGYSIVPGAAWEQLAFNHGSPQLKDANVRKAIIHSIDRDQITGTVLKKQVDVLDSTLASGMKGYYEPTWAQYKYDEAKIKQYLEAAGYERSGQFYAKGGKPLRVIFKSTAGNPLRMKVAQLLQQRMKSNGIDMQIKLETPAVFFGQSTVQGNYDLGLWAWSGKIDPTQTTLFSCDQIPSKQNNFEGQNNYRYCNKRATELMNRGDRTIAVEERQPLVKELQQIMAEDAALLPLYQRPETIAFSKRLVNAKNNPIAGLTWNAEEWWVAE